MRRCGGILASLAAAVVLCAASGCVRGPLDDASRQMFLDAHRSFEQGDYRTAEQGFGEVIRRNPTSWALSEVYYFRGLARLRLGERGTAKDDFRKGASVTGRELTQIYSATALAHMEYEEGNDRLAAHLYSQILDHPVQGLPVDAILYRLAVSLQRTGQWQEADRRLARLISDYPDSPFVAAGRRRFRATHFTLQLGAFADRRNADELAARARGEGYPVTLSVAAAGGKTLHAVCAGRFHTWSEASAAAEKLRDKGYSVLVKP